MSVMPIQRFVSYANSIYQMDESVQQAMAEKSRIHIVPKGKLILSEGDLCEKLWFVDDGLIRGFYYYNGKEVTSWFAKENNAFYSVRSFIKHLPSLEYIEALEDCKLVSISRSDLYALIHQYSDVNHWARAFAEKHRILHEDQLMDMRMLSAKDRLVQFSKKHSDLFLRANQKHIASYIGISEGYVSQLLSNVKI